MDSINDFKTKLRSYSSKREKLEEDNRDFILDFILSNVDLFKEHTFFEYENEVFEDQFIDCIPLLYWDPFAEYGDYICNITKEGVVNEDGKILSYDYINTENLSYIAFGIIKILEAKENNG